LAEWAGKIESHSGEKEHNKPPTGDWVRGGSKGHSGIWRTRGQWKLRTAREALPG